jgi:hypothetical protein
MANLSGYKPSLPITRGWLNFATVVELVAIAQLYFFSQATEKFFAWTISVPLTAAFLGAGFGAGFILVFLYRNETLWANARLALPGVLVFTLLTLAATFLHMDKFHLVTSADPVAVFFSWVWVLIYIVAPIVQALAIWQQLRASGGEPPREHPLPVWLKVALGFHVVVMLLTGLPLFIAPAMAAPLWPWALTPLTARAVAAWLVGIGVILAHALWENDWGRIRGGALAYAVYNLMQIIALFRFPDQILFGANFWFYVAILVSGVGLGGYGWLMGQKLRRLAR